MQVNLLNFPIIDPVSKQRTVHISNLSSFNVHAIDVYVQCETQDKLDWVLSPSLITVPGASGQISVSKFSVKIDSSIFPISLGSQGESSTNPITFERSYYSTVFVDNNGSEGRLGYSQNAIKLQNEKNDDIDILVPGQNIITNDYIPLSIIVNDPSILNYTIYGFGGSTFINNVLTPDDGFGGSINNAGVITEVEAYGGIVPNDYLSGIYFIIEKSKFLDDINTREEGLGVRNYGIRY